MKKGKVHFCRLIDGEYMCISENLKQDRLCSKSRCDHFDDICQYCHKKKCGIGNLIFSERAGSIPGR